MKNYTEQVDTATNEQIYEQTLIHGNKLLESLNQAAPLFEQVAYDLGMVDEYDSFNEIRSRVASEVAEWKKEGLKGLNEWTPGDESDKLPEMEEHYAAKTGKPLITDNERTALGDLASLIGKKPGDDQLEIF